MSKEHRAELEEVQMHTFRTRAELGAIELRIATATGWAEREEAELAVVQVPLDAIREKNRALAAQIRWENGETPPTWLVGILVFLVFLAVAFTSFALSQR